MCQRGYLPMSIHCHKCHARYHMDQAMFKGAKGVRVRCRKCGNSLYVSNSGEIASDRNVVNDTSFSWDPSDNSGIEPACPSQENGEDEDPWEEIWRKPLPVSADAHVPSMFYPPFPNSPAKAHSRPTFRWSSLIVSFILFLLVACGSAYLIFAPVGKVMPVDNGQDQANAVMFFRS